MGKRPQNYENLLQKGGCLTLISLWEAMITILKFLETCQIQELTLFRITHSVCVWGGGGQVSEAVYELPNSPEGNDRREASFQQNSSLLHAVLLAQWKM